ncbi:MAG TPA: SIR2 family protein [Candidatus Udaeobacter sp.]|jgi:NAD-dependent SIR2 family protein deacetylase|nr:SIR2 family protein [Candidatus Udaeobacter sp.]
MGRRLRIFVSSTMKDLRNERVEVVQRLKLFNFEAVNAENLSPTGGNSWETIQPEIASSDIMILLLGERYGWIPTAGPGAEHKISVTELEVREARELGKPILAFEKRLDEDADRTSEDAKDRDAFRKRIKDWSNPGLFVESFDLAPDLADKVGQAVIGLLSNKFQRQRISAQADAVSRMTESLPGSTPVKGRILPSIPGHLRDAVRNRAAVLFAGSGMSLSAGFPSAAAFNERFMQLIREKQPDYFLSPAASAFAGIATDLENLRGRQYVTDAVRALMDAPQNPQPTSSHQHAVRLFSRIITTNYDALFERAAEAQALERAVVRSEIAENRLPDPVIVKLHGSSDMPESLMLNEQDIILFDQARPKLSSAVRGLLHEHIVVFVGTSLRDPSVIRLLTQAGERPGGYFVSLSVSPVDRARLRQWNLEGIEADSDDFLGALAREVSSHA